MKQVSLEKVKQANPAFFEAAFPEETFEIRTVNGVQALVVWGKFTHPAYKISEDLSLDFLCHL